jgi:mono/diheme cytochrome c family protein
MARPSLKHVTKVVPALLACAALTACGTEEIELDANANSDVQNGARLFNDKCSGCHTLESAGAQGSAFKVRDRERVDGPNFNTRPEREDAILYAIRNGGFSGAIMPENIVVGKEAEQVAEYLAEYAGRDAELPVTPDAATPGAGGGTP